MINVKNPLEIKLEASNCITKLINKENNRSYELSFKNKIIFIRFSFS